MKKTVSLILTLFAIMSLAACGMTNDGYITDNPASTVEPSMTPAPGSGSVIDDSSITSPMPTDAMTLPRPTDAQSTDTPAASAKPSEMPAK